MITFSDIALGRSLGTRDPEQIQALADLLNDIDSPVALSVVDGVSEDNLPRYRVCEPDEEVDRILRRYGHRR